MKELSGLLSQIAPFAEGEVSALVNGGSPRRSINVSDLLAKDRKTQTVLVILIPTLKYQQIGHQLGKLLLQELGWAVGERAGQGGYAPFIPVFLDEFSSFVYPGFTNILNKARSSNVALHLSHQSLGDLGTVSDDFANIVMTNTNVKCILGLNDPETADYIARHLGTFTEAKLTERAEKDKLFGYVEKTGDLSLRQVEAYKVHPNTLKNLSHGRGVLHLPTHLGNLTETVQFQPLNPNEIERGKEW